MSNSQRGELKLINKLRTAVEGIGSDDVNAVKNLETILIRELGNRDKEWRSKLAQNLSSMEQKIAFIQSLAKQDKHSVQAVLLNLIFPEEIIQGTISKETIHEIVEMLPESIKIKVISDNLAKEITTESLKIILTTNLIRSSNDANELITKLMTCIPDTFVTINTKVAICKSLYPSIQVEFVKIDYEEPVKALSKAKYSGVVKLKEFELVTKKNNAIDYSQFILLVLGVIQPLAKEDNTLKGYIGKIKRSYINLNYEEAIRTIKEICEDANYSDQHRIIAVSIAIKNLKVTEVEYNKNYSRRFFENRLAAIYQGNINITEFDSINRILLYYNPSHQSSTDANQALSTIDNLSEFNNEADLYDRSDKLKAGSSIWDKRGRLIKAGFTTIYEEKISKTGDTVLSGNPGVMKSIQPNFSDEVSTNSIRNNQADTNRFDETDPDSYPAKNPRNVYAASISGHAYFIVTLLEKYIQNNKTSTTLEVDINNFIKAFITVNIRSGYHGMTEVMDVFNQPNIIDVFNSYGIHVNASWPEEVIDEAFKDTQTYTNQLAMQKLVLDEIKIERQLVGANLVLIQAVRDGDVKKIDTLINKVDVNTKDVNGYTALHFAVANNNTDVVKKLLAAGAKVNVQANDGMTPLHLSERNNNDTKKYNKEMINVLLSAGASPFTIDPINKKNKLDIWSRYNHSPDFIMWVLTEFPELYNNHSKLNIVARNFATRTDVIKDIILIGNLEFFEKILQITNKKPSDIFYLILENLNFNHSAINPDAYIKLILKHGLDIQYKEFANFIAEHPENINKIIAAIFNEQNVFNIIFQSSSHVEQFIDLLHESNQETTLKLIFENPEYVANLFNKFSDDSIFLETKLIIEKYPQIINYIYNSILINKIQFIDIIRPEIKAALLYQAIVNNHAEMAMKFLEVGADTNITTQYAPLSQILTIKQGNIELFRKLLKINPALLTRNDVKEEIINTALNNQYFEYIQCLLELHNNKQIKINDMLLEKILSFAITHKDINIFSAIDVGLNWREIKYQDMNTKQWILENSNDSGTDILVSYFSKNNNNNNTEFFPEPVNSDTSNDFGPPPMIDMFDVPDSTTNALGMHSIFSDKNNTATSSKKNEDDVQNKPTHNEGGKKNG